VYFKFTHLHIFTLICLPVPVPVVAAAGIVGVAVGLRAVVWADWNGYCGSVGVRYCLTPADVVALDDVIDDVVVAMTTVTTAIDITASLHLAL